MDDDKDDAVYDLIFSNPKTDMPGSIVGEVRQHGGKNISFDVADSNGDRWTVAIAVAHIGKPKND